MDNTSQILIKNDSNNRFGSPMGSQVQDGIVQWVSLVDFNGNPVIANSGDGVSGTPTAVNTNAYNRVFNGVTYDRERSNTEETFLVSAARNATVNSADFTNWNAKGLHVIIDVNVIGGLAPSIVPFIQGKDLVSGNYYDILEGLPITTVGTNIIKVFPGISAIVNVSASDILPRTYRVRVEHANTDNITYSVSGALVV